MTHNGSSDGFITKIADVLPAVTVTLGPGAATNRVDSKPCVTATAQDQAGGRVPGVTVRFGRKALRAWRITERKASFTRGSISR